MIDVNISIGHYPFRQFPFDSQDPAAIKDRLQACGVRQACVSSLHAIFYGDPDQGNEEVLPQVAGDAFYLPVGVVNPSLQNWEETLARCADEYGCRMVKLYPTYHMYRLTEPFVEAFLAAARERQILVAIAQRIEDERMHHPLMKVPAIDLNDLTGTAQRYGAPLVLLAALYGEVRSLARAVENLYFDISFTETMNTLKSLTQDVSAERLLFGTHVPFFYPEAATGKLEMWETSQHERDLVGEGNLIRLLNLDERIQAANGATR